MAHVRRRLGGAALAGAIAATALMLGAPVVSAAAHQPGNGARLLASCSGAGCDDKDPVQTGCAQSARTVAYKDTPKGRFGLYWSAACQTNWVQINNYAGGGDYLKFKTSDLDRPYYGHIFIASTKAGLHYGDMVWSPGKNCAVGHADWKANGHDDVILKSSSC
jgi:hypothetical protein